MVSRKRKAARQRRRDRSAARRAEKPRGRRREGRTGGRSAREIVALSNLNRIARQRVDEFGPGGGIKAVTRSALRSQLGRKAATVLRQQLTRIPGIGRFGRRTQAARQPLVYGNRAVAPRSTAAIAVRAAVPVAVGAGVAGATFEAGRNIFDALPEVSDVVRRFRGRRGSRSPARRGGVPFTPGTVVPTDSITHTWVANGVPFAQLADGRVMVRRKNGTIKTFRRPKPIVLGRNPGIRDISRAYKKIDTLLKVMRKHFPAAKTRTQQHSKTHN